MKLENYTKDQIVYCVYSGFEHIVWDMINNGGRIDNTNDEFFENFKKALVYLDIDISSIEQMNASNVLSYTEEVLEVYRKFNQKYKNKQVFYDCDILGEMSAD